MLAVCSDQPAVCTSNVPPQFSVTALGGDAGWWRFLILVMTIIVLLYVPSQTLDVVAKAVLGRWAAIAAVGGAVLAIQEKRSHTPVSPAPLPAAGG